MAATMTMTWFGEEYHLEVGRDETARERVPKSAQAAALPVRDAEEALLAGARTTSSAEEASPAPQEEGSAMR